MFPGLNDADCQVAAFHYRQLVQDGQQQQGVAGMRSTHGYARPGLTTIRRQLGTLLVDAGQRLHGARRVVSPSQVH